MTFDAPATAPVDLPATTDPDPMVIRGRIVDLEQQMLAAPQVDVPIRHFVCDRLYGREMAVPAGVLLVGKIHLVQHINVISKGCVSVMTETGAHVIDAPATFVSMPGTKRVILAHEDTIWTTFHPIEAGMTDIEAIEAALVMDAYPDTEALTAADMALLAEGKK